MSGEANSLCFYVFSVLQALMERRFTRKNTAFFVEFMFNLFFVVNLRVFCVLCVLAYGKNTNHSQKTVFSLSGLCLVWPIHCVFTCFFRFGLRGKHDLLVKNDTFGAVAIEFQVFYVLKTGG